MNIIEWTEGTLRTRLFPAQRFVLKMAYDIPLSPTDRIEFENPLRGTRHSYTEDDYRRFLIGEGRCHFTDESNARSLIVAMGRRGGKTTLVSLMALNAIRELTGYDTPQARFDFPRGCAFDSLVLSPSLDMVKVVAKEIDTYIEMDGALRGRLLRRLAHRVEFGSDACLRRDDAALHPDLRLKFKSSLAKGLKGHRSYFVALDEMAYMREAKDVYHALIPTLAAHSPKGPDGWGPSEGRFAAFSSPRGRDDMFHELFVSPHSLSLNIPTWEMNPTLPSAFYAEQYKQDPCRFMNEYGAYFTALVSDRVA